MDLLLRCLYESPYLAQLRSVKKDTHDPHDCEETGASIDVDASLYYLQTILNLITHCSNTRAPLASRFNLANIDGIHRPEDSAADHPETLSVDSEVSTTVQSYLMHVCVMILENCLQDDNDPQSEIPAIRQTSVSLLRQLLSGSSAATQSGHHLETSMIKTLSWSIEQSDFLLQPLLMDLLLIVLKAHVAASEAILSPKRRPTSRDTVRSASQLSVSTERSGKETPPTELLGPDPGLLDCLIFGLSSPKSQLVLEHWVRFLDDCLPFYAGSTFQVVMPLVDCLSRSIESVFDTLQSTFQAAEGDRASPPNASEPIHTLNVLFNGLEQVLARGHDQLRQDESRTMSLKTPEQVQGFFGSMVSGAFASDAQGTRSTNANNRLTVLLCFKDAVRVSFKLWSWGDGGLGGTLPDATSASFNYTSIRLRNRARRILEHLFAAEVLECLETLVESWHMAETKGIHAISSTVLNLLHALEASRPKNTMPALFNAIYSRTNPTVLDPARKSTLTSELSDVDIATFLAAYTRSMDDDALDEVWSDCMAFLKDVLGNPLPHRQTLPLLLEFIAILGEKIDNTNFGEQRKMRREIGVSSLLPFLNVQPNRARIFS